MSTLAEQIASLNLPPMTDEELAKFCGLTSAQWEKYKLTVTPDDVDFCHQARAVEILSGHWASGIEPWPTDVSVNRGRARKKRKRPLQAP